MSRKNVYWYRLPDGHDMRLRARSDAEAKLRAAGQAHASGKSIAWLTLSDGYTVECCEAAPCELPPYLVTEQERDQEVDDRLRELGLDWPR